MIFVGDIALPVKNSLSLKLIPNAIRNKNWFANLEGTIVKGLSDKVLLHNIVFNDYEGICHLSKQVHISGFALANNHLEDAGPVSQTTDYLNELDINYVGAGNSLKEASKPLLIKEEGHDLMVLNFGWSVIQCNVAKKNKSGVNPYTPDNVKKAVAYVLLKEKDAKVICYFHWNYEFELYPQPMDRELALELIEMGVEAIIGCHSHRVQPFELYKGKPIFYGLGNWMFPRNLFKQGKGKFPEFTEEQIAVEITKSLEYFIHRFVYNPDNQTITFFRSEIANNGASNYARFANYSNEEYKKFFKRNRVQKKMLPIYYSEDSTTLRYIKNWWVRVLRHRLIKVIKPFVLKRASDLFL